MPKQKKITKKQKKEKFKTIREYLEAKRKKKAQALNDEFKL